MTVRYKRRDGSIGFLTLFQNGWHYHCWCVRLYYQRGNIAPWGFY